MTDEREEEIERKRRREERKKKYGSKRKKRSLPFSSPSHIAAAAAMILVFLTIVLVVTKWNDISPESVAEKAKYSDSSRGDATAGLTGSTVLEKNLQANDAGLIYISDTSIMQLNHNCEKIYSEKHSYTDPMLKSSDKYSIAFGEGSAGFRIIHDKHKIYEGTQGTSITDCDINDTGTYCVLSDKTGYLSNLSVYDKTNTFIYSYSFSDYYAVCSALSPDGKKVAVGAINSTDGRLISKVYLLDVTKSDPIKTYTYEDQIVFDIKLITEDRFAVVTDMLTTVINIDGSGEVPYSYSSQFLTAYDIRYNGGIVLSLSKSDDGRNCNIVTIDTEGHEIKNFSTDLRVMSLGAVSDRAAVLSYGKLSLYTVYGDLLGEWDVGTDAKSVLLPQSKIAYILGVSGITKMDLKY